MPHEATPDMTLQSDSSPDKYMLYPTRKEGGLESPDIDANSKDQVTPDELFGPVSPRKDTNYNDDIDENDKKTRRDVSRNQVAGESRPSPSDHNFISPTIDPETQNKTHSRSESKSRDNTSSKTQIATDTDHRQSRNQHSTGWHHDVDDNDEGAFLKTSSVNVNRDNVNNVRSRLQRRRDSQNGEQSRASYNHSHILDDNLNISDSKLDNTLLRLFSRNSNNKAHYSDMDNFLSYSHSDFIGLEPVMWRVHPMNATHKETLTREMDFIAFHIKPREIISRLYKDGILTPMDYNQLIRTEGQGDRAVTRLMIRTLQRRGSKAYPALMDALLANDYFFVCERLTDSEHGLRNGVLTDRAESEWRRLKDGFNATPYRIHTPYSGIPSGYTYDSPVFQYRTSPLVNQPFSSIETWPVTNQGRLIDHMSPLHSSMPLNNIMTHVDVLPSDVQSMGNRRFDQRISDLDAAFRLIHQDLMSLKAANQNVSHVTSTRVSPTRDEVLVTRMGHATDINYLDQKLADLTARVTGLTQYVAAVQVERSKATKEPVSTNLRTSYEGHTTSPGHQISNQHRLDQQMSNLKVKLKELREEVTTLKATRTLNSLQGAQQKESPEGYRITDADKLDSHLRALRKEINMLHDDVTALKMYRSTNSQAEKSPNSTFRSTRTTSHRPPGDFSDDYLSPARQYQSTDLAREKSNLSAFNVIPGPLPHSSLQRYPSRYSPRDAHKSWDPDRERSISRADSVGKTPRNKKTASNRSYTRNSDKINSKSRNSSFYKDDIFSEQDVKDKLYKDDNSYEEDDKSNPKRNDGVSKKDDQPYIFNNDRNYPIRKEDSSKNRNDDNKLLASEDKMAVIDRDNILPASTDRRHHGTEYNKTYEPHIRRENNSLDSTEERAKDVKISDKRMDNIDNNMTFHEKEVVPETVENFKLGSPRSDKDYYTPLTSRDDLETHPKEEHVTGRMTISSPVVTSVDDKPSKEQVHPVPIIVIPDEKFPDEHVPYYNNKNPSDAPVPEGNHKNMLDAPVPINNHNNAPDASIPQDNDGDVHIAPVPYRNLRNAPDSLLPQYNHMNTPVPQNIYRNAHDEIREPGEKKKVRYSDTALKDTRDNHRLHQERPMSRAANPTDYRRVNSSRGRRELLPGTSYRPTSPTDSVTSDSSEYIPVTTPTRVLSPPHDVAFERVTTPYKILKNPNRRKITTLEENKVIRRGEVRHERNAGSQRKTSKPTQTWYHH